MFYKFVKHTKYICTDDYGGVEKKRLVIDLEEAAHSMLREEARKRGLTLSNHVRSALHLPLERQGGLVEFRGVTADRGSVNGWRGSPVRFLGNFEGH
jgi:hypothetical protein